jgi:hypothetical protein
MEARIRLDAILGEKAQSKELAAASNVQVDGRLET